MTTADPAVDNPPQKKPIGLLILSVLAFLVMAGMLAMPFIWTADSAKDYPDLARFVGRFHFLMLHLPIGFLTLVAIMEGINLLPFVKRKFDTAFILFASAVSSVVAVIAGFLLMKGEGHSGELMDDHMWGGIAFGCVVIAAWLIKVWASRGQLFRILTPISVYAACAVMGWAAHQGGALVHGKDFLVKYAPDWVPNPVYAALGDGSPRPEPVVLTDEEKKAAEEQAKLTPAQKPVWEHVITPILDAKCWKCHNEDKQSGKLRMDTVELMLKGGTEGPTLVKGDSKASLMMQRIHLPIDDPDEEHMPPPNKTQLEDFEIKILDWWVDAGAPESESVVELGAPEEIIASANLLLSPEERAEMEAAKAKADAEAAAMAEKRRGELEKSMTQLQADYPGALNFVSRESTDLTFTAVSLRDKFTDADLEKLVPVADALVQLDVGATSVSDGGMAYIGEMSRLENLKLSETAVTDEALETVATLENLYSLNLFGTQVTDAGVMQLADMPNLKRLFLWNSQVTKEGAAALGEKLPETDIVLGIE